jgi:uncharacterized protein (DUF2062 family)
MLFSRREAEPFGVRLRVALWPRRSWSRSIRYMVHRFVRLRDNPHALALGLAIGVFVTFQPILGFQMLLSGALAWMLGASVAAALIGTFVGCPLTWPLMWLASYHLGAVLLGYPQAVTVGDLWAALSGLGAVADTADAVGDAAADLARQVFYPLAMGALPLGLLAAAAMYFIVRRGLELRRRPVLPSAV